MTNLKNFLFNLFKSKKNFLISLIILFKIIFLFYLSYKLINPYVAVTEELSEKLFVRNFIFIIIIIFLLALSIFTLRLSSDAKIGYIISIFVTVIFTYSYEIYLNRENLKNLYTNYWVTSENSMILDMNEDLEIIDNYVVPKNNKYKSQFQIIKFLRNNSDKNNFELNFFPELLISSDGLNYKNERIFPLSGKSNIKTVFDEEDGYWPIIETDKKGFNNPKEYLDKNKIIDVLTVGDSTTEGLSVKAGEDISSQLRNLGLSVYNIGKKSNGPLIELASLIEYGTVLKPKKVLWIYTSTDIIEIDKEFTSNFLLKYLNDKSFTQDLFIKQKLIDDSIDSYLNSREMHANQQKDNDNLIKEATIDIMKLRKVRYAIFKNFLSNITKENSVKFEKLTNFEKFERVLSKAINVVDKWDGLLYFVYIPPCDFYFNNTSSSFDEKNKIKTLVKKLKINFIDIHDELFKFHSSPKELFPQKKCGHYNKIGYELISKHLFKKI